MFEHHTEIQRPKTEYPVDPDGGCYETVAYSNEIEFCNDDDPSGLAAAFLQSASSSGAATAADDASVAFNRFWITKSNNTEGPSTAVDDQGGIHVAFSSYTAAPGGGYPAYYAYCPASCSSQASWSVVALNNLGMFGGYTRVAVDASGRPRLLWYQKFELGADGIYWYRVSGRCSCESGTGGYDG